MVQFGELNVIVNIGAYSYMLPYEVLKIEFEMKNEGKALSIKMQLEYCQHQRSYDDKNIKVEIGRFVNGEWSGFKHVETFDTTPLNHGRNEWKIYEGIFGPDDYGYEQLKNGYGDLFKRDRSGDVFNSYDRTFRNQ